MFRSRRVGRRKQPALKSKVVKLLRYIEGALPVWRGIEELIHCVCGAFMAHVFVVGAIGEQQLFVFTQEWSRVSEALVPQQDEPSSRVQDAGKFAARARAIEPVGG